MLYTPGLYVADTLRETISIGIRCGDPLLALNAFAQLDTAARRAFCQRGAFHSHGLAHACALAMLRQVMYIDLTMKPEDSEKYWIKRGTAMLTQLDS